MPLARIITDSVEDSLELTMQLRARGFRVETVAPDQIPDTPVDLEVRLEECAPEDVLSKAAQTQGSEQLWVFVAPGALDERARPMRVIPLVAQVVAGPAPTMAAPQTLGKAPVEPPVEPPVLDPEDDPVLAELPQAQVQVAPQADPQFKIAGQNGGGAKSEVARAATPLAAPTPTIAPSTKAEEHSLVKAVTPAQAPPVPWQIPEIPERVEPINLASAATLTVAARKTPHKIAFRMGPRFWRTASVTAALVVLTGLLIAIVRLDPHLPAAGLQPGAITAQPALLPVPQPASTVPAWNERPARSPSQPVAPKMKKAVRPSRPESVRVSGRIGSAQKVEARHRPVPSRDQGIIAEDTVVFYDRRRPVPPAKAPAPARIKRYSDAN